MRIVSWNCNMGFEKKRWMVMSLQPDILVVQECSEKDIARVDAPFKQWVGSNTRKGLGIIGFADYKYAVDSSYTEEWPWFLPVRVEMEGIPLHILGLWACVKSYHLRYVRLTHHAIEHYTQFLSAPHMIAIGDFNSNAIWDGRYREYSHSQLVEKLGRLGLVSAYHTLRGELHGQEATPTWYMYRHLARPFHLDYAFVSHALSQSCELLIGEPDEWLHKSDHMPLLLTLAI
jgi:endonuclease/exonuclease/phosphatase family metal-dependent hydrolase